eukprot:1827084-Amphidinium_carterae.1
MGKPTFTTYFNCWGLGDAIVEGRGFCKNNIGLPVPSAKTSCPSSPREQKSVKWLYEISTLSVSIARPRNAALTLSVKLDSAAVFCEASSNKDHRTMLINAKRPHTVDTTDILKVKL